VDLAQNLFASGSKRRVASPRLEDQALKRLDPGKKQRTHEPGSGADHGRLEKHSPENLKLDGRAGRTEEVLETQETPESRPSEAGSNSTIHLGL
jgi:hypothetical protein